MYRSFLLHSRLRRTAAEMREKAVATVCALARHTLSQCANEAKVSKRITHGCMMVLARRLSLSLSPTIVQLIT